MKRIIALILTISMFFSLTTFIGAFADDSKLIFSESFENGLDKWTYLNDNNGQYSSITTEKANDGQHSAKLIDPSNSKTYGLLSESINCNPNEIYDVSCNVYNEEGIGAYVIIGFFDKNNNRVTTSLLRPNSTGYWESLKSTIEIPENISYMRIYLTGTGGGTGTSYVDNIKLYKKEVFHTIQNGGVFIEAEHTVYDASQYEKKSSSNASGEIALKTLKSTTIQPDTVAAPCLSFNVTTQNNNKKHYLWIRVVSTNGSSDSIWLSVNGDDYKITGLGSKSENEEDYYWVLVGKYKPENNQLKFNIINREWATLDKFILTTNALLYPEGADAPPEDYGIGTVMKLPEGVYDVPEILPPKNEHPRVLFKRNDISNIKVKMMHEENQAAVAKFNELKNKKVSGLLPDKGDKASYDNNVLLSLEAKAFDYAINNNEENGREAIAEMKNYLGTVSYGATYDNYKETVENGGTYDYTRIILGYTIFIASEIYDWCYPLLTEKDKIEFVTKIQMLAVDMEIGYPPNKQQGIASHGAEYQLQRDLLAFAIATYDEYPDVYNYIAGRYFEEYVPAKNEWSRSEIYHQGPNYSKAVRLPADLWGQWLIYAMSGEKVLTPETGKIPYQFIYTYRADNQFLREGDSGEGTSKMPYVMFLAGNFYKDPILRNEYLRDNSLSKFSTDPTHNTPVSFLIFNDPSIGREDYSTIPLTKYFGSPSGTMISHTTWERGMDSPDVLAFMKIGERSGANHAHPDSGSFQIYYKGILASESGWYENSQTNNAMNYNSTSIAHNVLAIGSSASDNVGAQKKLWGHSPTSLDNWLTEQYATGEVTGHEYGPDVRSPEYSYIAGDIAKSYSSNVKEAHRSMIFLPLEDKNSPAAFIVFDKVETDTDDVKKAFLLHMQEEPKVEDNVITITRVENGNNGKLTNQTLLPKDAKFDVIGGPGHEFEIDGVNYPTDTYPVTNKNVEAGWGRIEILPQTTSTVDYFLNVMYVGDADKNTPLEEAQLIEGNLVTGAKIYNRVAMFNKNKTRTQETVTFTVPQSDEQLKVNVAGLCQGLWDVKVNGEYINTYLASDDGGMLYFDAPSGDYELTYKAALPDKLEGNFSKFIGTVNDGETIKFKNQNNEEEEIKGNYIVILSKIDILTASKMEYGVNVYSKQNNKYKDIPSMIPLNTKNAYGMVLYNLNPGEYTIKPYILYKGTKIYGEEEDIVIK